MNNKLNLLKYIFIIFFIPFSLYSKTLEIDENSHDIKVLPFSKVYLDDTMKLKFDEIKQKEFENNKEPVLAYGYSPKFIFWAKFTIKNKSDKDIKKVIDFDHPIAFVVNLYDENGKVFYNGMENKPEDKVTINPSFEITFKAYEEKTFYLESSTFVNGLIINLNLFEPKKYYMEDVNYQIGLSLFFGAMLVLGFYNLFLFVFTKDSAYLYYVLYIFGIAFHQLLYLGYGQLHLFSIDTTITIFHWAVLKVNFPLFFTVLFTQKLLNTNRYPIINMILNLLLIGLVITSILCYKNIFLETNYFLFVIFPLLFMLIFTGFVAYKDKHPLAGLYLLGWFAVLSSWFFMAFVNLGIFNIFEYVPYYVELALVFEGIIFSVALAKRINLLQKENQELDKKLILQQEKEKENLQDEVNRKTKDLQDLLSQKDFLMKELHHRVKNNMQMIISLIRLQTKKTKDVSIKGIFQEAINRIKAMSNLHELLYKQEELSKINAYDYFISLIEELKTTTEKNISIKYDINTDLDTEDAIYCGLIINELVSNSIKYAFKESGEISISLDKIEDKFILEVKDNGVGYDNSKNIDSLGLLIVETLAYEQLEASLVTNSSDGVQNIITWENRYD